MGLRKLGFAMGSSADAHAAPAHPEGAGFAMGGVKLLLDSGHPSAAGGAASTPGGAVDEVVEVVKRRDQPLSLTFRSSLIGQDPFGSLVLAHLVLLSGIAAAI